MASTEHTEGEYFLPEEFLSDDFFTESDEENPKASVMGTTPQSTLGGIGNWSFSSNGSSNGSPTGPSQAPSPPATPFTPPEGDALDLLFAAVGQVERLNLNDDKPSKNLGCFYPNQELIEQQLQAARFCQLKRQQLIKMQHKQQQYAHAIWERQRQIRANAVANAINSLRLSPSEFPPLQKQQSQQRGTGMTAVFLNGAGRRQSHGTGVFLPRRNGAPTEPKKKQNCSTVLLPARVVQALNLNVQDMGACRPRMPGCYVLDENDALMGRSNSKRNHYPKHQAAVLGLSPEICLPREWTY